MGMLNNIISAQREAAKIFLRFMVMFLQELSPGTDVRPPSLSDKSLGRSPLIPDKLPGQHHAECVHFVRPWRFYRPGSFIADFFERISSFRRRTNGIIGKEKKALPKEESACKIGPHDPHRRGRHLVFSEQGADWVLAPLLKAYSSHATQI
jgi:hypothetical protein